MITGKNPKPSEFNNPHELRKGKKKKKNEELSKIWPIDQLTAGNHKIWQKSPKIMAGEADWEWESKKLPKLSSGGAADEEPLSGFAGFVFTSKETVRP